MKRLIARMARKVAPRTFENLKYISRTRTASGDVMDRLLVYEENLKQLKTELDEMRRDQRRMAELYDLVFERVRSDNPRT